MTGIVFLLCLAAGIGCGITDGFLSPLRKSAGIVFAVISDILLALILVGLYALIAFLLCDGRCFIYAAVAEGLGFVLGRACSLPLVRRASRLHEKRTARKKTRAAKKVA